MYEDFFDSTDERWLRIEVQAWIDALSSFQTPLPSDRNYPSEVLQLLSGAELYLRQISLAQVFSENLVLQLHHYVGDLLSKLGGPSEALYTAFTIRRVGLGLKDLVEEAKILAQEPMSVAEKDELRASLSASVQSYGDKLAVLKRNLDAGNANALEESTTSQPGGPPTKPPSKRKARKRKRSGN